MNAPRDPATASQRRRRGGVVGPLVLIFLGAVFLLQNTGYLPPNLWMNLWRLWPLILVLAGIELLLAHRIPWLALAGLVAVVLILGAVATNSPMNPGAAAPDVTRSAETNLGGATEASVTVRFGAGQLNIGPLTQPSAADQLAVMTYSGPPDQVPQAAYSANRGGVGQLEYQIGGRGGTGYGPFAGVRPETRMDVNLAPAVPITSLTVQTGATEAHLDLSSLQVSNLDISIGAASAWIRLPQTGKSSAHISGGASSLTLEIPPGVAAQIQHRGGLNTLNIDQSRFPSVGDGQYQSPDYATAENKVDVIIETGVTTIQVN